MEFNIDINFFEGDLCSVDGYGHLIWEVERFAPSFEVKGGKVVDEYITYTLQNVHTGEDIIAFEEDLSLICRAKDAIDYIRQLNKTRNPPNNPVNTAGKEKAKMKTLKATVITRKQKDDLLNELLDRYNDVKNFIKADGEITERYQKQLEEIEAELNKVNQLPTKR
ncbi:hypothetical protein ABE073_05065 [Lederbergia citrisecunda]|uniref:hypothetical protein n=1 Tax=Lederbergia citrisecunda TaxID=2833583 RepID=UPI003D285AAF